MHYKQSSNLRLLMFNALLWLCGVTLLFMVRDLVALFTEPLEEGWLDLDLVLVLIAYVFLFLLRPIRNLINRRLRKRDRHRKDHHGPDTGA